MSMEFVRTSTDGTNCSALLEAERPKVWQVSGEEKEEVKENNHQYKKTKAKYLRSGNGRFCCYLLDGKMFR